uniref:Uncharacterized protein n=1 Tax=Arundo donax TaxID=35708 RepID=A0A0A9BZC8_ARUDO
MLCYGFSVASMPRVMLGPFRVGTVVQALQSLLIYSSSHVCGHGLTGVRTFAGLDFWGVVFWTVVVGSFWIPAASREELET